MRQNISVMAFSIGFLIKNAIIIVVLIVLNLIPLSIGNNMTTELVHTIFSPSRIEELTKSFDPFNREDMDPFIIYRGNLKAKKDHHFTFCGLNVLNVSYHFPQVQPEFPATKYMTVTLPPNVCSMHWRVSSAVRLALRFE